MKSHKSQSLHSAAAGGSTSWFARGRSNSARDIMGSARQGDTSLGDVREIMSASAQPARATAQMPYIMSSPGAWAQAD